MARGAGAVRALTGRYSLPVAITSRPATGLEDLRAAERLLSEAWLAHGPTAATTPGDLEWWFAQAHPAELGDLLRLWFVDDRLVGWSWFALDETDWHVDFEHRGAGVEDAILNFIRVAPNSGPLRAWAREDDPALLAALERHDFRPTDERLTHWMRRIDDGRPIPEPELPDGYTLRTVRGDEDVDRRVEAHRQAFAPSRMTAEKYRRLMTLPHYRPEHDFVVVAPDGAFAAFTMAWWDRAGRVGELEPVGTHPHHRRQGLGRAANLAALRLFASLDAMWAGVYSVTSNAASEALYASVGFEVQTHHRRYIRDG